MADSPQWIAAKAHGDDAEVAIAEWFRGHGWEPYKTLGRADFDLLLQCEVEVKADLQAVKTGNIAIETAYREQPSGILTSKATWWAIVFGTEAAIVKKDILQRFVFSGDFREVRGGDNHASTLRLVPVTAIRNLSGAKIITLDTQLNRKETT